MLAPPQPRRALLLASILAVMTAVGGSPAASEGSEANRDGGRGSSAARLSPVVDHPLVPLSTVRLTIFAGRERDPRSGEVTELRFSQRALRKTGRVGGERVAVVAVREYEDGQLVEATHDYYAQRPDGTVLYMGERVNDYEDGELVGHEGAWLAGRDGAMAGIFMPARPRMGDRFEQERVPGVAQDRSRVVGTGLEITTAAGHFSNCIKSRDYAPLDRSTELKFYCPGVGLVREQSAGSLIDLVRFFRVSRRD